MPCQEVADEAILTDGSAGEVGAMAEDAVKNVRGQTDRHWRAERPVLKNCRKIAQAVGKKETCHWDRDEKWIGAETIHSWQDEMARNR